MRPVLRPTLAPGGNVERLGPIDAPDRACTRAVSAEAMARMSKMPVMRELTPPTFALIAFMSLSAGWRRGRDRANKILTLRQCGIFARSRPWRSLTLYHQMIGRGLRRAPDKANCLVLDYDRQCGTSRPDRRARSRLYARRQCRSYGANV